MSGSGRRCVRRRRGDDRFERAVEDGTDELTNPGNPMSIPEPGSVMGVAVGAIALLLLKRKSKPQYHRDHSQ